VPETDLSVDQIAITSGFERLTTWARRLTPRGLSASSFTTLDTLSYAGPLRISELADREGMTQPGMTTLVNRLEHDGLAQRATDPTDGRAALVSITETGRARVGAYRAMRAQLIGERLTRLDPSDQAALRAAVDAIERLTDDRRPAAMTPAAASTATPESGRPA
jgi:DNA-binding MarR family transcriptional regulator